MIKLGELFQYLITGMGNICRHFTGLTSVYFHVDHTHLKSRLHQKKSLFYLRKVASSSCFMC